MTVDLSGHFKRYEDTQCLELARTEDKWLSRELNGTGEPVLLMSVKEMKREDQFHLYGLLQSVGLEPKTHEFSPSGVKAFSSLSSFRLHGDDIEKFKAICEDYGPQVREIDAKRTVLETGVWQDGRAGNGTVISRMAVSELSEDKKQSLIDALHTLGMEPQARNSATLGATVRVSGDDVIGIMKLRKEAIVEGAHWSYQDIGVKPLYIGELRGEAENDYTLISNALQGEKIDANFSRLGGMPAFNVLDEASIGKMDNVLHVESAGAPLLEQRPK